MIDSPLLFLGIIGFLSVLAIALSRLIDKPAPGRNFAFAFFISIFAFGFIADMAQSDSVQIGVFRLGFVAQTIFASLSGGFTGLVLATIYRGNMLPAIFSGALMGITTFFTAYFIPPSNLAYPEIHDLPSLLRIATPIVVGVLSYTWFSNWSDGENNSD